MVRVHIRYLGPLMALTIFAFPGCGPSGPVKHEVTGRVLVDDKPVAGVSVFLRHTSDTVKGKSRMPIGFTDENGVFNLSTDGAGDGAVEGEYIVTFVWMNSNRPGWNDPVDRFGGRYADTNSSPFRLKIPAPDGQAEAFRLQRNPKGGE